MTDMNKPSCHFFAIILLSLLLLSCNKTNKDKQADIDLARQEMSETYVDTLTLRLSNFNKQVVCNGRLRAKAKSVLGFNTQGLTVDVHVKDGQRVGKGALIATSDKREPTRDVEKAENELERARVELIDKLIGLGYDADMKNVPEDVLRRAEVTSGYYTAKFQLQAAKAALADCNLYAPFAGRIADVEGHPYQHNDKICTLIDDSQFEVEFSILEAELANVSLGQMVKISPFIDEEKLYTGTISEINPLVSDKGLVKIKARMSNGGNGIIDGMNVKIIIEQSVNNMFVVPKDAVVERDGYYVIFIYNQGRAIWTYVDVLYSNIGSYAITGSKRKETTIHEGDVVITSGNLNLADGTEVKLQ